MPLRIHRTGGGQQYLVDGDGDDDGGGGDGDDVDDLRGHRVHVVLQHWY